MNKKLLNIITQYQHAVADMFPRLATHLGIATPISDMDWLGLGVEQRGKTSCGIKYFIHGGGVSMKTDSAIVEFDLGGEGQIDGIDIWKLADFVQHSHIKSKLNDGTKIGKAIRKAVTMDHMFYNEEDQLYYLK